MIQQCSVKILDSKDNDLVYACMFMFTYYISLLEQFLEFVCVCWFFLDVKLGNFDWTFDMASKRDRDSSNASSGPPAKKLMTQFEPVKIGPICSLVRSSGFVEYVLSTYSNVCLCCNLLVVDGKMIYKRMQYAYLIVWCRIYLHCFCWMLKWILSFSSWVKS